MKKEKDSRTQVIFSPFGSEKEEEFKRKALNGEFKTPEEAIDYLNKMHNL